MIQAISTIFASSIARRIGNVQTMVVTHLPASILLALIPLPKTLTPSLTLVALRSCISQMDVGPRSAFVAAIVLPGERTAIMGVVNVVKTFSQSIGPGITGLLAEHNLFWVAFVLAGGFKIVYDLGLLGTFIGFERRDDVPEGVGDEEATVG
jgi:MFS family permease